MPVIRFSRRNSQSRIQAVPSMHEGAWITLEGNVISQQQEEWYTFRDPTGTIKVRIPQKVWNGQHFDSQDLVLVERADKPSEWHYEPER
jgi:uncharacterized protein (TIGR00156 family)